MNDHPAMTLNSSRAVSVIVGPSIIHNTTNGDNGDRAMSHHQKSACINIPSSTAQPIDDDLLQELTSLQQKTTFIRADKSSQQKTPEHGANRMSYPREFKLLVISYYFQHGQNKYRTCKEFQITKSMLNGWLQKIDKIQQSRPGSLKSGRSGRKPQFPAVEKQLYNVYAACLQTGKKVGNRWLRDTAKVIAQRQCTREELNGMCQFSERWLCNFKKRYNINLTKDWNGDVAVTGGSSNDDGQSSGGRTQIKPNSDGHSCQSPVTPETSSNSHCEADSSTSPKNGGETPRVGVGAAGDEKSPLEICIKPKSPSLLSMSPNNVDDDYDDLNKVDILPTSSDATTRAALFLGGSPIKRPTSVISSSPLRPPATAVQTAKYQPYEPGRRGRKVQFPQVEEILYKNLCSKQTGGVRVSNRWLQDEARRLAVELCPEMFTNAFKSARCMFSEHWLHNFKKRYGISLKHQHQQFASANAASNVIAQYHQPATSASTSATATMDNDDAVARGRCSSNSILNSYLHAKREEMTSSSTPNVATPFNVWDFRNSLALAAAAAATIGKSDADATKPPANQRQNGDLDLPTMVPLTTSFNRQSLTKVNLAEWYSQISNTSNMNQCLQLLTDEVRLRQATTTTATSAVSMETVHRNGGGEYER